MATARARDGGTVVLQVRAVVDRFRSSLFGIPALWVAGAIVASQSVTAVDRRLDEGDLPTRFATTVDSSRALLGAITTGTITAASVVFSLTLLAVQLSSSVYSSRVLRMFLRDRFQQNVMGLVVGAFFFSVLVLREVRGPLDDDGTAYVPRLSIALAILAALAALLALLASINHTARQLRVSTVSHRILEELRGVIDDRLPAYDSDRPVDETADGGHSPDDSGVVDGRVAVGDDADGRLHRPSRRSPQEPSAGGVVLVAEHGGWVQQIGLDVIANALPAGTTVRVEVAAGGHVPRGAPLLTLWPVPDGCEPDDLRRRLARAFVIGEERTTQQDIGFGIVMLEDIVVRALSPGVNDPNTARAVLALLSEVCLEILLRPELPTRSVIGGCTIHRHLDARRVDHVAAAFDQTIHFASSQPVVLSAVVDGITAVADELVRRRRFDDGARAALAGRLDHLLDRLEVGTLTATERARLGDRVMSIAWYERTVWPPPRAGSGGV